MTESSSCLGVCITLLLERASGGLEQRRVKFKEIQIQGFLSVRAVD